MSKIDKLSILGVRSFDNRVAETIQFYAPLTLIVGLNGSGKTTVIECLKYVTTGELPPNSARGGAFIHDPQLCGEKEVLAQVKMSFKSTSGIRMVATRNLQLTVKKTTRSQKTLEGQLQMVKDGERTSISTRVAELDQMLPQYLGVSKAILEYVIFCHQEESLWPLSEPAALKKRFDEIFEAMKYTKAIENIKQLKKKQTEELGKLKIIEQHAKDDKDRADRDQKRMNVLYEEIEKLREKALALNEKVNDAKSKSENAWEKAAQFDSIIGQLNGKRIEAEAHMKSTEELKQYLTEMTDSDEALQSMLNQYEDRLAIYEKDMGQYRLELTGLSDKLGKSRQEHKSRMTEIGRCEAEQDEHRRQIARRESLVNSLSVKHQIAGFEFDLTDSEVRDFVTQIDQLSRDKQLQLDKLRRANQERVEEAQRDLNELSEQRNMLNQKRGSHKSVISTNESKISDLRRQINQINVDVGVQAKLEANIRDVEERLEAAKSKIVTERFDDRLAEMADQLRDLDSKKDSLDAELVQATKQAGDTAKLDYLQKELKERKASLESMISTHQTQLESIIGGAFEIGSLERRFQTKADAMADDVREHEARLHAEQRRLQEAKYKLDTTTAEHAKRKKDVAKHEAAISDVLEPGQDISEFPEVLQKLSRSLEIVKTDSSNFAEMRSWYEKCLQTVQSQGVCRLCQQSVKDGRDRGAFVQRLEKQIARATAVALEDDIKEVEEEWARADAVRVNFDTWKRITEQELPGLEKDMAALTKEHESRVAQAKVEEEALFRLRGTKQELESESKTVQTMVKYHVEVTALESEVETLFQKTKQAGLSRPLGQIQDDVQRLSEKIKEVKAKAADLASQQTRATSDVNALELEARDVKTKLNEAIHKLETKSRLEAYVQEHTATITDQLAAIQECDADIQALLPKSSAAQTNVDNIRRSGAESERTVQAEANSLAESNNQLRHIDQQVQAYIDRDGEKQLEQARRDIAAIEGRITVIEQDQSQVTAEMKKTEDQIRSFADTKREITDNLRYRQARRQLETVRRQISELEEQNVEADKDRYSAEGTRWSTERNRLAAEQASVMGELKGKDNQLQDLIQVWEADYKDAAYKFKEAHIKVETTKAVVDDLGRYGGALDQAIMKYHSIKMEEINQIVEELWKKTYQGTDVDTIMIKSDSDGAKGNKSYNYRVVMVKADAEMDMRGRCSAGQKVLASIIIRLGLAECFGVNCGLIALDEPTTNLDSENIRALALSLHEIIRIRRQQANFQLIVITHDEEFLRAMQCADFADSYWRISRNAMMKSVIEKQQISEVI